MYCIKCGVELEEHIRECPLCNTKVPILDEKNNINYIDDINNSEYPKININLYNIKMKKIKKGIFLAFFTISIISILEIFFQNIIMYKELRWGYFAIPSILVFDLFLFIILNSYTMRQNLLLILIGLSSYFIVLDIKDNYLTWSKTRGIPIVIAFYVVAIAFSFVWDKHKKDRIKIMNFFLFFVGIFLLILEFIISKKFTWSVLAAVPLFVLNIMLRYTYKLYKEEFKRRLHL